MLLISAGLTATSLWFVRRSVQSEVRKSIFADLQNSVDTYHNFQKEREITLTRSADLLADLPTLRALMTTQDEATIQDASDALWKLGGSDLFVLADRSGKVVALHTSAPGLTRDMAGECLNQSLGESNVGQWCYGGKHLYEVFVKPVYFGPASDERTLGYVATGYEIDAEVASQVSRIAASQVAFFYGDTIVKTTLSPAAEAELSQHGPSASGGGLQPRDLELGHEHYVIASLELAAGRTPSVRLAVLKSYDQATAFLDRLNRLLIALGLAAVLIGSALVFLISHTFTRPLDNLVAGVRALGRGDYAYRLDAHGGDEVAEVTTAFNRMRQSLLRSQQELLEAERLATIGRMASSISHDLRHSLAAIVANAEFLCAGGLTADQREELYQEVRVGVNQMTDLIDSLLEFSRTRESLRPIQADVRDSVERVLTTIRAHPDYHRVQITVTQAGASTGSFDPRKLERALYNLLANACEAAKRDAAEVSVSLERAGDKMTIRVADNGSGIPESIRWVLFEPFVSFGKENGTGLGLTVVQKIVQDHGGEVAVEQTSERGTVFRVTLPLAAASPASSVQLATSTVASATSSQSE